MTRTIRYLILAARWEGGSICPGAKLSVNIWYVLDDAVLGSKSFDTSQAEFVAIGTAKVKRSSLWTRLFRSARLIQPEQRE